MLDGSISAAPDNVLLCATPTAAICCPNTDGENEDARIVDGELHHGEAVEEKSRYRSGSGFGCRFIRSARMIIWPSSVTGWSSWDGRRAWTRPPAGRRCNGVAARLAQRPGGLAVRPRLGRSARSLSRSVVAVLGEGDTVDYRHQQRRHCEGQVDDHQPEQLIVP